MLTDQIATFRKVSYEQYLKDCTALLRDNYSKRDFAKEYENIKLPSRATSGSVGFDFYLPFGISLSERQFIVIPTGIRCEIQEGYSLDIYPKSGIGFKTFATIANTVGIIDSDYYFSDNEGHIMIKLINKGFDVAYDYYDSNAFVGRRLNRKAGESFVQGIFHECFGATNDNDNHEMKIRNGGFDSTR